MPVRLNRSQHSWLQMSVHPFFRGDSFTLQVLALGHAILGSHALKEILWVGCHAKEIALAFK